MFNQNTDILIGDKLLRVDNLLTKQKTGRFELYDFGSIFQSLVKNSQIGVDVAPLVSGLIPQAYLPSYVDDVLEYANILAFPAVGETGKIYVDLSTGEIYRWSGSVYVEISKTATWGLIGGSLSSQTDLVNTLNAKQDNLVSGTNIRTVNGATLLGSTNLQVGTILGTLPATAGQIGYSNGTLDTLTSSSAFTFNGSNLKIGVVVPLVTQQLSIASAAPGPGTSVGMSITNTAASSSSSINIGESLNNRFAIIKYGSTYVSTITGTSISLQNSTYMFSVSSGIIGGGPLYLSGLPIISVIGSTTTNIGTRLDATGLRVGAINTLHTINLNTFTVNGGSMFGSNVAKLEPTASIEAMHRVLVRSNTNNNIMALVTTSTESAIFSSYYAGGTYTPINFYTSGLSRLLINTNGNISIAKNLFIGDTSTTPTTFVDITGSTSTQASLRIRTGVAPTTPNDGDIWFDGTGFKARVGGVTKTFTLI